MQLKQIYRRFLTVHILTGLAFALLFSLGSTYLLAASNPFLLIMSVMVPVLDVVVSKRHVNWLKEDEPSLNANRILFLSFTGFGLGILLYLVIVLVVFSP